MATSVAQERRGAATLVGGHHTAEDQQRTVVPATADKRRESTTGYKRLGISTPGDDEISGLQVLDILQHGIDDDDDEMQLVAQTAQQLESRRHLSLNYAELPLQRGKRYPASDTGNAETDY